MTYQIKYTRKAACGIMAQEHTSFDRAAESDQASNGGFRPEPYAGQHRYGINELVALDYQLCLRREGVPVRLAGSLAARLHTAISQHPAADRLALVTLANGNRFAAPADSVDLATGYSSGAPVREALVIDARNLRARIADMIERAALIVGEADDEG